ncbi:MAG: hypothetical protein PHT83_05810, partial [Bacilli bacterium]|nr:hypothetical protein [Bacilli bacterium]
MNNYNVIIENIDSTVVSSYESNKTKQSEYQSEADLEKSLIKQLISQGYEYLNVKNTEELFINLKSQLEKLNNFKFSNKEWNRMLINYLANPKES